MKWFMLGAMLALGSALASAARGGAANKVIVEEIIGQVISAEAMYEVGDQTWYTAQINIQEGGSNLKSKSIHTVQYPFPARMRALAPWDDEMIKLVVHRASPTDPWKADLPPTIIDRAELLNPAQRPTEELGSPTAKILIKMLAPLSPECHQKTAKLLRELLVNNPDRLRIQLFDMQTAAGREEMNRERVSCATILVNNRYRFTLETPEGKRYVSLRRRPNETDSSYRSEDVIAVVAQELQRVYREKETGAITQTP